MTNLRILVVGSLGKGALEHSYINASKLLGHEVEAFDPGSEQESYIQGGSIGRKLHAFLPVEQWMRKMNRKLVIKARDYQPQIILLFTNTRILPGTLACIKTVLPTCKLVWIWPDSPLNLEQHNFINGKLVDLTATYSKASIPAFQQLGFSNVNWVPLAADPHMHGNETIPASFATDIGFVGGWRPERERIMSVLCDAFSSLQIDIHGPYWKRECKNELVKRKVKSEGLYEKKLSSFFHSTSININIIDDTNYPAANMRFFEVPVAGGLQLSSPCPEQETIFSHRTHIVYFQNEQEIIEQVRWILENKEAGNSIRIAAQGLVLANHCYKHRLQYILEQLNPAKVPTFTL